MEIIKYGYQFLQIIPRYHLARSIARRKRCTFSFVNSQWRRTVRTTRGNDGFFRRWRLQGQSIFEFQARRHKGDHVKV